MTHLWVLVSGFFFANFMCLIAIWNNYSFNSLEPKYVASSYDPNRKDEMESLLLKSVEKYVKKYFSIKTSLEENMRRDLRENNTHFLGELLSNDSDSSLFKDKIKNYQTIKNSESSKFSMFLDKEKENVIILKISNEGDKINKYDSKIGEIILYSIPVDNFVPSAKKSESPKRENLNSNTNFSAKKNYIEKSLIKECWSSKFFGRIIGAVASSDKKKLSIFYRVVKGHTVSYRIRYFHDIACNNALIKSSDAIMIENFNNYIDSGAHLKGKSKKANSFIENYFEISDDLNEENNSDFKKIEIHHKISNRKSQYHDQNNPKEKNLKNYFDDFTYDDFLLKGNTPITAMAIKEDVIAYARDLDYRQYYILKREKKFPKENSNKNNNLNNFNCSSNFYYNESDDLKANNKVEEFFEAEKNTSNYSNRNNKSNTIWKVSSLGPKIDRKMQPFFHTNSLKFMDDPINDYRLIHIFVSMNTTDVSSYGYLRISNHTDFNDNFTEFTFTSIPFFRVMFINEILDSSEDFNLERSIKKLKKYLQPTLFSNNFNSKDMIFEFAKSYLLLMHSNSTTGNVHFIRMRPDAKEKISKLHSDMENQNIIIVNFFINLKYFKLKITEI